MEKKFRKGEVVWAKVRGFPWWPAMVKAVNIRLSRDYEEKEIKEITLLVYFIGDDSHSELPISKIEKFIPKLEEYSKTKKKQLLTSIKLAQNIISGEIPFEKHLQFAKRIKLSSKGKENKLAKYEYSSEDKIEDKLNTINIFKQSSIEDSDNKIFNAKFLGLKKLRNVNSPKGHSTPRVDFRVNDDEFSKNIKINININVNNNTNNLLNITSSEKKNTVEFKQFEKDENQPIKISCTKQKDNIVTLTNENDIQSSKNFSESYDNQIDSFDCDSQTDPKEELVKAVDRLLFYKIEMSSSSCNRSIITSLKLIESKLIQLKNCNIYNLIKDLIPILHSFVSHKNQLISTKSTELIAAIKEKVLSEIFEFENEKSLVQEYLRNIPGQNLPGEFIKELSSKIRNQISDLARKKESINITQFSISENSRGSKRYTRKSSIMKNNLHSLVKIKSTNFGDPETTPYLIKRKSEFQIMEPYLIENVIDLEKDNNFSECFIYPGENENTSESKNETNHKTSNLIENDSKTNNTSPLHLKSFPSFNSNQIRLLFKDFIIEEGENSDFKEKLNNGYYSENFYQNVYNKYNGLSKILASKRKYVCLKLLNILKLILPEIDTDTLKKTIIFIEYNIRIKDPTFGNIYKKKLETFYDRLKNILSIATESINSNLNKSKTEI